MSDARDLSAALPPRRELLGTHATITSRARIYLGQEGIEIDEHTGFASGQRTRVLFDEVQLVTLDRRRSKPGLWISAGGVLFVLLCCAIAFAGEKSHDADQIGIMAFVAVLLSAPFWIYLVVHLISGADYVTVFGKRSTAKMSFLFRKARAREVFALIRERIQVAQNAKSVGPAIASETGAPGSPIA